MMGRIGVSIFEVGGDSLPIGLDFLDLLVAELHKDVHGFSHVAEVAEELHAYQNSHCD